jgi:transcriptional regulator of NAD metabolism
MTGKERRDYILKRLEGQEKPVNATKISEELNVSRQIIVGDVALLRASGVDILSSSRGYRLGTTSGITRTIVCKHKKEDAIDELVIVANSKCTMLNVSIAHLLYGTLTGELHIDTMEDVVMFQEEVKRTHAKLLSELTNGVHTHLVEAPNEEALQELIDQLDAKGYIYHGK